MQKLVLTILLFMAPGWALAQELPDVEKLYIDGKFEKAVALGQKLQTLEGLQYALRSKLVLVQYVYPPEIRLDEINTAISEAEAAREKFPDDVELMISTGILTGLRGRYEKSIKDGKRARELFEMAIAADPGQAWALGALGSWHAETIYEAGAVAGRLIMGAKKKLAYQYFDLSLEADSENIAIKAAYIRGLLKLKPKQLAGKLRVLIQEVKNATPKNALERILQEQIRQIETAWKAGEEEKLKTLLDEGVPLEMVDRP